MQDSHFVLCIWRLSLLFLGVIFWYTIWLILNLLPLWSVFYQRFTVFYS